MKKLFILLFIPLVFLACQDEVEKKPFQQVDLKSRQAEISACSDYIQGKSYLPVYSHIYHSHEQKTFNLTATISIRNISMTDTIYILHADYFNTRGANIRQYIKSPIFIKPMETVEIIIDDKDSEGGSGANFVFDWAVKNEKNPPLFEAVMISTYGQQGLSFSTRGVQIFE